MESSQLRRSNVVIFYNCRSSEGRLNLARRSNQGPGVECLIANTVFSFVDKEQPQAQDAKADTDTDKEGGVVGQLETTVVSQLNLSIDILDIKNKQ